MSRDVCVCLERGKKDSTGVEGLAGSAGERHTPCTRSRGQPY